MIPLSESTLCIPCGKYGAVTHEMMAERRKIAMLKKGEIQTTVPEKDGKKRDR